MKHTLVALVSLLLTPLAWLAAAEPSKPNIVLILADDLGYGDVGCYGATKAKTPNIDRLANEGRRFTDAHSASAVCTPSRYALLTGEYPFRKNLWRPVMNASALVIAPSRTTVASLLKRQGYATACFGKWHLGFGSQPKPDWNADLKPGPLELGFDHYFGIPVVSSHPPFVWVENHRVVGLDAADPLLYGGKAVTQEFPEKMLMPAMSGTKAAGSTSARRAAADSLAGNPATTVSAAPPHSNSPAKKTATSPTANSNPTRPTPNSTTSKPSAPSRATSSASIQNRRR